MISAAATEMGSTAAWAERLYPFELQHLQILAGVSIESVWGMLEHCPIHTLAQGDCLLSRGESNGTLYCLLSGSLSVHGESPDHAPVAVLPAGVAVGALSVIDGSPASAYLIAASPCRLLAIDEETFWRMARASHELSMNLLLLFANRMRATHRTASTSERGRGKLEQVSMTDALTGLKNRRWLEQAFPRLVERCCREDRPVSVAILDVDHFKLFNDTYGHAAGDQVLVEIAKLVATKLRPLDIGARYGGEEFVVVFPDATVSGATDAAERLREMTTSIELVMGGGRSLPRITISIGVAEAHANQDPAALLRRADAALYRAKVNGRNRVEVSL